MSLELGGKVRKAREAQGWSLDDICAALEGLGAGKINLATLSRMETGDREGDPVLWGKLWTMFQLPILDLYRGLGLPLPEITHKPMVEELAAVCDRLPAAAQAAVLAFARVSPAIVMATRAQELLAESAEIGQQPLDDPNPAARSMPHPDSEAPHGTGVPPRRRQTGGR